MLKYWKVGRRLSPTTQSLKCLGVKQDTHKTCGRKHTSYDVRLLASIADVNWVSAYRGFLREKALLLTMKSA
jgi:hypothetical protein